MTLTSVIIIVINCDSNPTTSRQLDIICYYVQKYIFILISSPLIILFNYHVNMTFVLYEKCIRTNVVCIVLFNHDLITIF